MLKCRPSPVCRDTYTLTLTHTCSHDWTSHSPNQFHSQASCQAAMLSKYYHNACVSVSMQLMNGWQRVRLRDTETERLPTHCYCGWTPPPPPPSVSPSLWLTLPPLQKRASEVSTAKKKKKTLQQGYLCIWRLLLHHMPGGVAKAEHLHKTKHRKRTITFNPYSSRILCMCKQCEVVRGKDIF